MTDRTEILRQLRELHLQVSALFCPFRWGQAREPAAAAILERRSKYFRAGLPVVGGGTEADRQVHFRLMRQLQKAGLVSIHGRGRDRSVKFTARGFDCASALVPTTSVYEAFPLLGRVAEFADAGICIKGGRFVLENDLIGCEDRAPTSLELTTLEDQATPLCIRGWMESMGDTVGHVGYALTAAGRRALEEGPRPEPGDLPEYDPAYFDWYVDRFIQLVEKDRHDWKSEHANNIAIPLSAGLWMSGKETNA